MNLVNFLSTELYRRRTSEYYRSFFERLHLDGPLLLSLLLLALFGFVILMSAAQGHPQILYRQAIHLVLGFMALILVAQISPYWFKRYSILLYIIGFSLVLAVLGLGKIGKGAQRWIEIGWFRFQPSELMKFAVPMMLARLFSPYLMAANWSTYSMAAVFIMVPAFCIAKQPDLGTAILISLTGFGMILFTGIRKRHILIGISVLLISLPILWTFLHDYQRNRIITLFNPESDPLGSGYHIIQSKIAIGSGGLFGKGWLQGSQSHLHFLPEHATDFIFAVCGEEFGLLGCLAVMFLIMFICYRSLYLSTMAKDQYGRLLSVGLCITFFSYAFVNIGMTTGLLPVVGIPLPFISYGGTSLLTLSIAFGVIMSIYTHRKF